MRVFVTGASGFIGSATVGELRDAGHQVLGLARSDESAAALSAAGAEVHRGALDDLDSLRGGAAASDGVIHLAFNHDFSQYQTALETDRRAIEAMGEVLAGSDRPLVVAGGVGAARKPGQPGTEEDPTDPNWPRVSSDEAALSFAGRGVRVSLVRLPPTVHGESDKGFATWLINIARDKGVSAYPGDGTNRWPAVHRLDAAQLFRLAVEKAPAGTRLHAAAEAGIPVRDIAEAIGRNLKLPVTSVPVAQAVDHFGFLGDFFSRDVPTSSTLTQQWLDWHPVQPGLISDLDKGHYFA